MLPPLRTTLSLSGAAVLALALLTLVLPPAQRDLLLTEHGLIEQLSAGLWLLAAGTVMWRARLSRVSLSFALLFLLFCVRETGLPKWLIPSGKALLRPAYYLNEATPLFQRLLIASLLIAALVALCHVAYAGLRYYFRRGGFYAEDGHWFLAAAGVLVLSQGFEALPDRLALTSASLRGLCQAFEELLECVSPLLMVGGCLRQQAQGLFAPRARSGWH